MRCCINLRNGLIKSMCRWFQLIFSKSEKSRHSRLQRSIRRKFWPGYLDYQASSSLQAPPRGLTTRKELLLLYKDDREDYYDWIDLADSPGPNDYQCSAHVCGDTHSRRMIDAYLQMRRRISSCRALAWLVGWAPNWSLARRPSYPNFILSFSWPYVGPATRGR